MNVSVKQTHVEPAPSSYTISGFFSNEDKVKDAMVQCLHRGVPRDLIDVAVSEAASKRFFGGRAGASRDSWFSWTGRGALAGLIISALVTLGIALLPGFNTSSQMAFVQLLGPDIGIIVGAALGALYGWIKPGDIRPQMLRATERSDAVLMLVHLQPEEEAKAIEQVLAANGGEAIRVEQDTAKSVGAE